MAGSIPRGADPSHRSRYFFKVFFPEHSSDRLRIPEAFREHIQGEFPRKVWLKGPSGKAWGVELVRDSDKFFFEDGWKEFVANHSVEAGDFLVFQRDGRSRFTVLVFDSTACEKEGAFLAKPCREEAVIVIEESEEEEEEEEEGRVVSRDHFFPRDGGARSTRKRKRGIDELLAIEDGSYPKKTSGDCSKSNLKSSKLSSNNKRGSRTSTCSSKSKDSSSDVSNCLALLESGEMPLQGEVTFKVSRMGRLISQRRPVTVEEVKRALQMAKSFKSKNPLAIVVMQDSYVYTGFCLGIPGPFVREHLPKVSKVLTLWDPNGRSWNITYIFYNNRGSFSAGWGKFSYANNLEKYDVCVFECIKKTHILVHIFRVVEEITPLLRNNSQY